jgi:catechol 2,3-dioxygenase-like lactoylglutathione lyase family enzyme
LADFRVQRLDHVHVAVRDRRAAILWYHDVLGLSQLYDYTEHGDPRGPVVLSSDNGETHLALFERKDAQPNPQVVAFRVDADGFRAFLAQLDRRGLRDANAARVTADSLADHGNSWSIYFCDPDGNPYEITTYDYAAIAARRR